ncbi:MAG: aldo/keto reductase [Tetragenococcus halophilus]|nr:aldo/keto reductase [Tetragenococcus halophilus]
MIKVFTKLIWVIAFSIPPQINNEGMVDKAVRSSSIPRKKLYISDKLSGLAHKYDKAIALIQESLYRTGLDYFDMYLIHWPSSKEELYVKAC